MTSLPKPTEAELEILGVLWRLGPSSVRAVHEALVDRGTRPTTTLKLMQIMTEKGLIQRDGSTRPQRFRTREPAERTRRRLLGALIDQAFGGSAAALVQQALSQGDIDPSEREAIRRLLGR